MLGCCKPRWLSAIGLAWLAALLMILMPGQAAAQLCVTETACTNNGGFVMPLFGGPPGAEICQATDPSVAGMMICTGGGAQASTTTISSAPNPSSVGQSVTLTATVIGANPTGSVTFVEGLSTLGTVALTGGTASLTTSSLSGGTHSIAASYTGDANNLPSTSTAVTQTVNKVSSTVDVSSSANPSQDGASVTFTATVSGNNPTGNVTFRNGAATLGTVAVSGGGTATFTTSTLPVGSNSITAAYAGDTNNLASTSSAVSQTVNAVASATTVSLSSSLNPSQDGASVTFTATVSGSNPTGNVTFRNGATTLGTVALSGGSATLTTSTLPVGSNSITAAYAGDTNNLTSTSSALSQTVNAVASATTVSLSSSANPSQQGASVTFTATVSGNNPTGNVTFRNGAATLGTVALSGGTATFTTSTLPVGTNSITAAYAGDTNNLASTSSAVSQTVNAVASATTVSLSSSANPSQDGASVTFTATVSGNSPTGNVTFRNGAATLGTVALSGGSATFTTTTLPVGTNSITAAYAGDTNNLASTSSAVSQTVNAVASATTVSLSSSANPSQDGASVTFTATVSGNSPTGNVTFRNGATTLGTVAVSGGGTATFTTSTLPVGSNSITAAYAGDTNNLASTSSAVTQTVNAVASATTVSLSSSASTSLQGVAVKFTVRVSGNNPTGTVYLYRGSLKHQAATLTGGVATFTSRLPAGVHSLTASYPGDTNNPAGTSSALSHTVNKHTTTTTLSSSLNPSTSGQSVTFTATVTGSSPTGTVTFFDGATSLGTGTLSGGSATLTTSTLPVGSNSITAAYAGDTNNLASTSSAVSQAVNAVASATTVSLSSSPNPSQQGASITFTATVSGNSPTGNVTFRNGAATLGTVAVSGGGTATFTTSTLPVGSHSITASYSGDVSNKASTSSAVSHTVSKATPTITLSSSTNPSELGKPVTFTATVTGNNPAGTVEFFNGSSSLGASTLNGGTATLTTSELPAGALTIKASYAGDPNNKASTSAAAHEVTTSQPASVKVKLSFTVTVELSTSEIADLVAMLENQYAASLGINKALIEIVINNAAELGGSPNSFASMMKSIGSRVVTPAHAAPANKVLCANVPVVNGIARCRAEIPLTARHRIKVTFTGEKNGVPTKVERTLSVKSPSGVLLSIPTGPVAVGQPFTMKADVVPPTAQGTVSFANSAGGVVPGCGAVPVVSGKATCTANTATAAAPSFVATYSGGDVNEGSTSKPAALALTGQTAKTVATIAKFLSARNNQILTNEPDSDRQVDRLVEADRGQTAPSGAGLNTDIAAGFASRLSDGPDASSLSRMRLAPRPGRSMSEPMNIGTALDAAGFSSGDTPENLAGSGGPLKVNGSTDGADRYAFATSLRDMMRYAAESEGRKQADKQRAANGLGYSTSSTAATGYKPLPFDVWIEGNYTSFRDDENDSDTDGHIALISVGADYVVNRSLLVGTVIQFDSMRQRSDSDATEVSGEGWMAGPYVTLRLSDNVFWQSRALWGRSSNEVSPFLTYEDRFDTERWLASSKLSGRWDFGAWSFRPSASIAYIEDTSEAYVDAFGALTPSVRAQLGQAKIGPELSYKLDMADGTTVTPFGGAQLIWNFAGDAEATGAGSAGLGTNALGEAGPDGVRGRVELGIKATTPGGIGLDLSGFYDGIGAGDYDAVTGQATLRVPLN